MYEAYVETARMLGFWKSYLIDNRFSLFFRISGSEIAVHVVRLLREAGGFPTIPSGYVACGYC